MLGCLLPLPTQLLADCERAENDTHALAQLPLGKELNQIVSDYVSPGAGVQVHTVYDACVCLRVCACACMQESTPELDRKDKVLHLCILPQ